MRIAISAGSAHYDGRNWSEVVDYVEAADRVRTIFPIWPPDARRW